MAKTLEELMQENQELREQLRLKGQRIQELEKIEKEHETAHYKKFHDKWVGSRRGRGIK